MRSTERESEVNPTTARRRLFRTSCILGHTHTSEQSQSKASMESKRRKIAVIKNTIFMSIKKSPYKMIMIVLKAMSVDII